jgi:hypothetical protein
MPNATPQINLDLRNSAQTEPGWVNVAASNGQTYSYSYTGGDDGAGGLVQTINRGRDTAPLRVNADRRYKIADTNGCVFTDDPNNQLTWNGNSPYAGSIVDANTAVETAKYTINITDTGNGNCNIPCDPPVRNEPNR